MSVSLEKCLKSSLSLQIRSTIFILFLQAASLLKQCLSALLPALTTITNVCLLEPVSFLIILSHFSSKKIHSWQRRFVSLSHLPSCHFWYKSHRTCSQKPSDSAPLQQWSAKHVSSCLYTKHHSIQFNVFCSVFSRSGCPARISPRSSIIHTLNNSSN